MSTGIVEKVLKDTRELSTIPQVIFEALDVLSNPLASVNQLVSVIKKDPALVIKLLRYANSVYFKRPNKDAVTIKDAVLWLGERNLRLLVLSTAIYSFTHQFKNSIDIKRFWKHSLEVAIASHLICENSNLFNLSERNSLKHEVYICGLLHDIGILLFENSYPEEYLSIWRMVENGQNLIQLEKKYFDITHAELAFQVLQKWGIPNSISEVIKEHHSENPYSPLSRIVSIASSISYFWISKPSIRETNKKQIKDNCEILKIDVSTLESIRSEIVFKTIRESEYLDIHIGSEIQILNEVSRVIENELNSILNKFLKLDHNIQSIEGIKSKIDYFTEECDEAYLLYTACCNLLSYTNTLEAHATILYRNCVNNLRVLSTKTENLCWDLANILRVLRGEISKHLGIEETGNELDVWYATDREPDNSSLIFSSQRDNKIHFGKCKVYIPESHEIGSQGAMNAFKIIAGRDSPLKILEFTDYDQDRYWNEIKSAIDILKPDDNDVLIFIHGFNVSFIKAVLTAAQLGCDINFPGIISIYSWPSQGTWLDYPADLAANEGSEENLRYFITEMAKLTDAKRIHIIAHSMGNKGLLRALQRITDRVSIDFKINFDNIILAAPDVDQDNYKNSLTEPRLVSNCITSYVSSKDKALKIALEVFNFPRVGFIPPVTIINGVDTIDASKINRTFWGHGYWIGAREMLCDIHALIFENKPPNKRFGLKEIRIPEGVYWQIKQ